LVDVLRELGPVEVLGRAITILQPIQDLEGLLRRHSVRVLEAIGALEPLDRLGRLASVFTVDEESRLVLSSVPAGHAHLEGTNVLPLLPALEPAVPVVGVSRDDESLKHQASHDHDPHSPSPSPHAFHIGRIWVPT
jgi:hypothetical protein